MHTDVKSCSSKSEERSMSRTIEPIGWSDMTQEKKEDVVAHLARVGLLDLEMKATSNELLDVMYTESAGTMSYIKAKLIVEYYGVEKAAKAVKTKQQAIALNGAFGTNVVVEQRSYRDPVRWADIPLKKKEKIISGLSCASILDDVASEPSNAILERMVLANQDGVGYLRDKWTLLSRGIDEVAKGVQHKLQAVALVKAFGNEVIPLMPKEALNSRKSEVVNDTALSR